MANNPNYGLSTRLAVIAVLGLLLLKGQTPIPSIVTASASDYIAPTRLPSGPRECLMALGDRIQKPGKERLTLIGSHTEGKSAVVAQLTWEVPGRIRYDRNGTVSLISDTSGVLNAIPLAAADQDILESLLFDTAETFLYGFVKGRAQRPLGRRFRADDGKALNYAGPWFDIYQAFVTVVTSTGSPVRQKHFYFDSDTQLLTKTTYVINRGSKDVSVTTEFNKWSNNNGQTTPGQIVRREGGVTVFTLDVISAAVVAKSDDGLFPKP